MTARAATPELPGGGASTSSSRRGEAEIWITGIGAVSAFGWGREALWQGLVSPPAGGVIRRGERFDVRGQRTELVAEVPPEPAASTATSLPEPPSRPPRFPLRRRRRSRADDFAVDAAREALGLARWSTDDGGRFRPLGPRSGVFFGTSTAGMPEGEEVFDRLLDRPGSAPRLGSVVSHQMNGPGDEVARTFGIQGAVETLSSACAAAALALGEALDALQQGEIDVALAGGSDVLCQLTYSGFNALRAMDESPCRPFRGDRAGLSLGEGAGVLVLERSDFAARRGARPLARLLGAGASCDAHHMTAPHPEGEGAERAIRAALTNAAVSPSSITLVNAHGTGTPHNDSAEALALGRLFQQAPEGPPVTSTKGAVGHLLGASGALEAVATVLCLHHRQAHPTPGSEAGAEEELAVDLVTRSPRPLPESSHALSSSFAFGGANAALIFASPERAAKTGTKTKTRTGSSR
ncbi:MAG: beta-ketoacyl-[acyl-carrier-protein] synthase family protein [Acidobacteriota bacterium]